MNSPKISLIVAMAAKDRGIGFQGGIPWKIPREQRRFKETTIPHPIIMGRKTFESIGRVLPHRTNIVITRDPAFHIEGVLIVHSLEEAIEKAREEDRQEIFIIGGGQIFEQAIHLADKLYLTLVEGDFPADTYFPDYSEFKKVIKQEDIEIAGYKYKYLELEK